MKHAYQFPKIVKAKEEKDQTETLGKNKGGKLEKIPAVDKAQVEFMKSVHGGVLKTQPVVFSFENMPHTCSLMQIGQYYQPLPSMSSSADAKVRCTSSLRILWLL